MLRSFRLAISVVAFATVNLPPPASADFFEDLYEKHKIAQVELGAVATGDFDGDGDQDLLVTGVGPQQNLVSKIYRNDSDSIGRIEFTDIGASLVPVAYSSVGWADYDGDGDLDVLLTGYSSSGPISKVYRTDRNQNGEFTFTDIAAPLANVTVGSAVWGDYDGDGDSDILITGFTSPSSSSVVTKIYRNDRSQNGTITFTNINAPLIGVGSGTAQWGDYDADGDLDVLVSGQTASGTYVSKLYRADRLQGGTIEFTEIAAPFVPMANSAASWGDFDNDGDLDLLLSGYIQSNTTTATTKLYRADRDQAGAVSFVDSNAQLEPLSEGSVAWGDYDHDGDLDILLTGQSPGVKSIIYRTDIAQSGAVSFTNILAPITPVTGGEGRWADFDGDGYLDVIVVGTYNNPVSAIHRATLHSGGQVTFTESGPFPDVAFGKVAWCDIDADGDLDTIITGSSAFGSVTKIFRSTRNQSGNVTFTDIGASLAPFAGAAIACGDYDGDGDRDLLFAGSSGGSESVHLYRTEISAIGEISFTEVQTPFPSIQSAGSVEWGDYDQDGDLDLLFAGHHEPHSITKVYRSDRTQNGQIVFTDIGAPLIGVANSSASWGDFDGDGDLDILLSGVNFEPNVGGSELIAKVYRADRNQNGAIVFVDIGVPLTPVAGNSSSWGDYDGDGYLDILLSGESNAGAITKVYRNDPGANGAVTFTNIGAPLEGIQQGSATWADFDRDGDLDILLSGFGITKLYRAGASATGSIQYTASGESFLASSYSSVDWGDFDGDGDLDILFSGFTTDFGRYTTIYRNLSCQQPGATCACGAQSPDTDGDGTPDCADGCPGDPGKIVAGVCGCGVLDTDTDGDGTANCVDQCPLDSLKSTPGVCGCGVADTDSDGDGTPNCNDACPTDPTKIQTGQCGCGVADTDSDGDGSANCIDQCPSSAIKTAPGQCGCNVADTDGDGDGSANCVDGCPTDPAKVAPGVCGCGVAETACAQPRILSFSLINADTDQVIPGFETFVSGTSLNFDNLPTRNLSFRANTAGTVGSVRFKMTGLSVNRLDLAPIFSVAGETGTDYVGLALKPSKSYTLTASPYLDASGSGVKGADVTVLFKTLKAKNKAPKVTVGKGQTLAPNASTIVTGSATDDGFPVGAILKPSWKVKSKPTNGVAVIENPNAFATEVGVTVKGSYVLQLTVTDGQLSTKKDLKITVK